ncbi:MAG: hypothetical protein GX299_10395 [Epulopiscium sp.]|nr:hypothetical protein [Candidatus Epulonipiscium sp.]
MTNKSTFSYDTIAIVDEYLQHLRSKGVREEEIIHARENIYSFLADVGKEVHDLTLHDYYSYLFSYAQ